MRREVVPAAVVVSVMSTFFTPMSRVPSIFGYVASGLAPGRVTAPSLVTVTKVAQRTHEAPRANAARARNRAPRMARRSRYP